MLVRNGAGPVTAGAVNEARRFLAAGNGRTFKPTTRKPQASCAIRAELTGSSSCKAAGITARGSVLALCQLLVQAGFNPDRPLHAYRGATLCLIVRSIGEAAGLEINNRGTGFVRHRAVRAGPPMRQKRRGAA
jgi:hypothetical protein